MHEQTLSLIKPDAVGDNHIGAIISRFEQSGLKIAGMKLIHLSQPKAEAFYAEHSARPFFGALVKFMISGPLVAMVLEGENAIAKNREIMGATDPAKADAKTLRKDFGASIDNNAVHGSDSPESAKREIAHFFAGLEIFARHA
jgi:nucleoside-diphosphate kinase